jgi:hypothetical protein
VFQLVVITSVEMFGVSLGQVIAAITPSVQVGILFDPFLMVVLTTFCPYTFDLQVWGDLTLKITIFYKVVLLSHIQI